MGEGLTVASSVGAARAGAVQDAELESLKIKYRRAPLPGAGPSAARVELGRTLFFDPRLSRASSISCASCHNPGFSWGDGLARGVGFGSKSLGRRTPTVLNVGWGEAFFWDGRAETLEQQALGPIAAPGTKDPGFSNFASSDGQPRKVGHAAFTARRARATINAPARMDRAYERT